MRLVSIHRNFVRCQDPEYNNFMQGVERSWGVSNASKDVLVSKIFTDSMFSKLIEEMEIQRISN